MRPIVQSWVGARARLRAIEADDWTYYCRFNEDAIQSRNVFRISPPISPSVYQSDSQKAASNEVTDAELALAIERVDEPGMVGAISVKQADTRSGSFEHGLAVEKGFQRAGLGSEATLLLLRYMFGERRYHKSIVSVYEFNEPSLSFHAKFGYVTEGRLREQEFFAGRYWDVVLMGLLADEFFCRYSPIAAK